MSNTEFVYTTYIKSTPEKVWNAITNPEFTKQYWRPGITSDWKKGSRWQHVDDDGTVRITGEVLESTPPTRLVMTWVHAGDKKEKSEHSRVTFEIESIGDMVRLNVIHGNLAIGSDMASKIAIGWPRVLSSMKSLLETGKPLDTWAGQTEICTTPSKKEVVA